MMFSMCYAKIVLSLTITVMLIEILLGGALYIWDGVKKEKELKKARNQALVNQIKPHFIFNTMSSIYYMAAQDPESVMPAIDHFSEYLQANFRAFTEEIPIPFEEETEHTKAYIEVEKLLHKDSLKVNWDITFRDFVLPSLSLQPLVENAIKHGMKDNEALTVTIGTVSEGKEVLVFVEDDGVGIGEKEIDLMKGEGALKNIAERIKLLSDGSLSVKERKEGGTRAQIRIPLKASQTPS